MNSMTGFGAAAAPLGAIRLHIEISGVNRKQTEIVVSLPKAWSQLEQRIREYVASTISRGRANVTVSLQPSDAGGASSLALHEKKIAEFRHLLDRATGIIGQPIQITTDSLIRLGLITDNAEPEVRAEAVGQASDYLTICFAGIPFITAYNVISSIFRGAGDSRRPMYFVAVACVVNVALDFVFVGRCGLGAAGAALGTVCGQAVSVAVSLALMRTRDLGIRIGRRDIRLHRNAAGQILRVGAPIALQDGLIQIAFIVITVIANSRGLVISAAVGIVEKLIGFMFLVPSAFLSAISTITAQNMGAKQEKRARQTLYYGLAVTVCWGLVCAVYSQFLPHTLVGLFTRDGGVLAAGCEYLRSYAFDCVFAAVHFCFSGYFCGDQKSMVSFVHNITAILLVRIPGAWLASVYFPHSLYPMGWAAPLGSLLSALICVGFYLYCRKEDMKLKKTVDRFP